jgi:hypothetical protein
MDGFKTLQLVKTDITPVSRELAPEEIYRHDGGGETNQQA